MLIGVMPSACGPAGLRALNTLRGSRAQDRRRNHGKAKARQSEGTPSGFALTFRWRRTPRSNTEGRETITMPIFQRILVPVDGSATSERGLEQALALARELRSTIVALYVCEPYPLMVDPTVIQLWDTFAREQHDQGVQTLDKARAHADKAGLAFERVLDETSKSRASTAIIACAQERRCDLIVMGTHGRRGIERAMLGSDAERVVRTSPVPVLLVRAPEGSA
jgi:nucleotide-binding universal stress UspA family protein